MILRGGCPERYQILPLLRRVRMTGSEGLRMTVKEYTQLFLSLHIATSEKGVGRLLREELFSRRTISWHSGSRCRNLGHHNCQIGMLQNPLLVVSL